MDFGRILEGFWEGFWKDLTLQYFQSFQETSHVEGLALMIRATRGRSMDGWMDGWMDGEVLIIGKVVGWSFWVPKGLVSVEVR